jgi:hypothetical protein
MNTISSTGRKPTRRVLIGGIEDETREQIVDFALSGTGETKGSLFGWRVGTVNNGQALVELHTD